jgi:hypothetical protein
LPYRFQINLGHPFHCRWRTSRDLRRQVPCKPEEEPARRWDADLNLLKQAWWEDDWQATPLPVAPTTAKLIPIVTTAATADAVTLAQLYGRRWPAQENIIRDYLLALGLDTNHGYAKTAVVNSEVAKRRTALEQRLATLRRWTVSARERYQRATTFSDRLRKQAKARGETLYRGLNERIFALEEQGMADHLVRREIKERKATIDAELQGLWQRVYRVEARQDQDWRKQERYCREQREVLRALEDLACKEREMFELDNRKDQVMTICKVATSEFGDVDARPVFPSHLCACYMETSCTFLSPAGTSNARSQGHLGRVTTFQRPPTQPRPRRAV